MSTILVNANIYVERGNFQEAMLIENGIIKAVGMDMVKLEKYQGFAADMAGAACLLLSSLTGIPVSTTHTKTTAIMGVGASRSIKRVNWSIAKNMLLAWVITFPACGLIGFVLAKLFMMLA